MALIDTGKSIGKVTQLLVDRLSMRTGLVVAEGRPEPPGNGTADRQINLFLYEASFDPSMKNIPLQEGQPEPLWLVLKYLLTAFDSEGYSDNIGAHENLGVAIRSLQELNFLSMADSMDTDILRALGENPEPLKITFDETSSDLIAKLMQGADEKYRFSLSFQVRPVMIATGTPPSYSLLVGYNYEADRVRVDDDGRNIRIIPFQNAQLTHILPEKFEWYEKIFLFGNNLEGEELSVTCGPLKPEIITQDHEKIECRISYEMISEGRISAGDHPLSVGIELAGDRRRSSNLVIGSLLPTLSEVAVISVRRVDEGEADSFVYGTIDMTGYLLAGEKDDILVAFYRENAVVKMVDEEFDFSQTQPTAPEGRPHTKIRLIMKKHDGVPPGEYRLLFRVNGEQAKSSPVITLRAE